MKSGKAGIFLMILLATSIALMGCAKKSEEGQKTIQIGIVSQWMKEQFYRDMQAGAEAKAEELGIAVEWQVCDGDAQRELEIVNNYISRGFDVIAIEPVSPETSASMMEAAAAANIPVVDIEAELIGGDGPIVRVSANFRALGQEHAKTFLKDFGADKPINVVILAGYKTDFVAEELVRGNHDILDQYPNVKIIQETWHENWDRQLAMNTVQNVLARGDRIDGILANNDGMGIGAVRAAEEAGVKDNILFYGMDHDVDAVQEMKKGTKYKTMDKSAHLQGQRVVEAAYAVVRGEAVPYDEVVNGIKVWYTPFRYSSYDDLSVSKEVYPDLF
jgi:ABC-type sugar transport system substrate-binding protein